jgi:hypothetical protein
MKPGHALVLALVFSCKPSQVNYPDDGKVASSQKQWCAALARVSGDGWQHQNECETAHPSGSAAFLSKMAECYRKRHEEFGENAPDDGALVSDCTETVLAGAEPGNVSKSPVVKARCERSQRCDNLPVKNCFATFSSLDGMQRAVFTSLYNLRAQNEIAGCLSDSDCGQEPEDACLKKWYDQRVWLPLSLAPDMGTAPVGAQ